MLCSVPHYLSGNGISDPSRAHLPVRPIRGRSCADYADPNGVRLKIQEQPFRVLILLAEGSGEIVTRETLRQELWPAGTHVDFDGSLNVIMKKLRAVLGDDPDNPRFIETVPRHGYRFIAPMSSTEIPTPSGKTAATSISGAQLEARKVAGRPSLLSNPYQRRQQSKPAVRRKSYMPLRLFFSWSSLRPGYCGDAWPHLLESRISPTQLKPRHSQFANPWRCSDFTTYPANRAMHGCLRDFRRC